MGSLRDSFESVNKRGVCVVVLVVACRRLNRDQALSARQGKFRRTFDSGRQWGSLRNRMPGVLNHIKLEFARWLRCSLPRELSRVTVSLEKSARNISRVLQTNRRIKGDNEIAQKRKVSIAFASRNEEVTRENAERKETFIDRENRPD